MARDCTIYAKNLTKAYGAATPLVAELMDNNIPLSNRNMVIRINGVDYRRVTNESGLISLNINLLPGNYSADIKFNGDSEYNPATKSVSVKILRNDTPQKAVKHEGEYFEINGIPLKVVLKDGFSTTMGTDIKETELLMQSSTLNAPTFYFNKGDHGIEFDISVVMKETYYYNDLPVMDHLNQWNKLNTPVSVVTDAMDVPNSKYIMTIKSKKQTNHYHSIWKLHFHQFYENNLSFEYLYRDKTSTLSALDRILVKYLQIDANSPKEAILALQKKLVMRGCWTDKYSDQSIATSDGFYPKPRKPNGEWDDIMQYDIFEVQSLYGLGLWRNGVCDKDTINALLDETYEGESRYYDGERRYL